MAVSADQQENPGNTLYVSNIYEKLSLHDTEDALRTIFARYGSILDIVARSTHRLRGQAWIVFEQAADASRAMQDLDGFPFMRKPIKISHATLKSDAIARKDGTYNEEMIEARRQSRRDAWAEHQRQEQDRLEGGLPTKHKQKRSSQAMSKCIISVENIPKEANEGMLLLVFQRFPGLKEVRMIKAGNAQVEYTHEEGAAAAVAGLQGFKLATDKPMKLTLL